MQAGNLDRLISIVAAAETVDASGSAIEDWGAATTVCTVWSAWKSVIGRSGAEREMAGTLTAESEYDVWIRRRVDVTVKHRVVMGSPARTFDILAVLEDYEQRNHWTRLRVRENLNG